MMAMRQEGYSISMWRRHTDLKLQNWHKDVKDYILLSGSDTKVIFPSEHLLMCHCPRWEGKYAA